MEGWGEELHDWCNSHNLSVNTANQQMITDFRTANLPQDSTLEIDLTSREPTGRASRPAMTLFYCSTAKNLLTYWTTSCFGNGWGSGYRPLPPALLCCSQEGATGGRTSPPTLNHRSSLTLTLVFKLLFIYCCSCLLHRVVAVFVYKPQASTLQHEIFTQRFFFLKNL